VAGSGASVPGPAIIPATTVRVRADTNMVEVIQCCSREHGNGAATGRKQDFRLVIPKVCWSLRIDAYKRIADWEIYRRNGWTARVPKDSGSNSCVGMRQTCDRV